MTAGKIRSDQPGVGANPRSSRKRVESRLRAGISLVEAIVCLVIVSAAVVPLVGMIQRQLKRSKSTERLAIAESLVREGIEHLHWRRRRFGFVNGLWVYPGIHISGVSNTSGTILNPPLDVKYRRPAVSVDPSSHIFDREIRVRWKQILPGIPGRNIRFLEVVVTIYNQEDSHLSRPVNGNKAPFYQVSTWIGEY